MILLLCKQISEALFQEIIYQPDSTFNRQKPGNHAQQGNKLVHAIYGQQQKTNI